MCTINMMRLQKISLKVFKVVVNARSTGLVWKASANQHPATSVAGSAAANQRPPRHSVREMLTFKCR